MTPDVDSIPPDYSPSRSSPVMEEQVRILYLQAPLSNIFVVIISACYFFLLKAHVNQQLLLLWLVLLLLTASYRFHLWYSRKKQPELKSAVTWQNQYIIGTGLVGCSWSLIYSCVYGAEDPVVLGALLMLAFGVISAAVPVLAASIKAFIFYAFPQAVVLSLTLLRFEEAAYQGLSVIILVYVVVMTMFTRNMNRNILQFIDLQEENTSLIENLNDEIEQRESLVALRTQELREKNQELHRAQKMEAIGLMAGGVAHDLNNILSGIIGYPELLLRTLPNDSELRRPLEAIHDSGQRAAAVVADLLTVARGAASTREVHDLNLLTQEYLDSPEFVKLQTLYPQITYQQKFEAEYPDILCSSVHVKKCLMNLVTNAVEAIGDTGVVTLSTANTIIDSVRGTMWNLTPGEYVIVSILDTGPGVPTADLEHVFEPFYTKKIMGRSGTGLGLTVIWNAMEDHGGKVLVESSNKGTRFTLYFPVSKERKTVRPSSRDIVGSSDGHILVVDDEPYLIDIASKMLRSLGYEVAVASSGEEAVQFVKETEVDLIVLDMLMEPGINGRQTYEEILKLYPEQKAIIASGFSESDEVKAALGLGAGAFIKKPYSIQQLGKAVQEALSS